MASLLITIITLSVIFLQSSLPVSAFCPIGCTCIDDPSFSPSVECDGAGLTSIPILFNPRIRTLRLSNNQISSVLLEELGFYTELEHLDLSDNKILSIERGAFYRLQKLKTLRLNGNLLASLSIETFAGLAELRILDLSDNGLRRLATSVFSDLRRLEVLNVSAVCNRLSSSELHILSSPITSVHHKTQSIADTSKNMQKPESQNRSLLITSFSHRRSFFSFRS